MSPEFIAEFGYTTRVNYIDPVTDADHENCMLYIDEEAGEVYNVNLNTEEMTSIF